MIEAVRRRLVATPTMGFLFGTSGLEAVAKPLERHMPPGCHIIGAATEELQALVPPSDEASRLQAATVLHHIEASNNVALMLGSFPDAIAQSFYLSPDQCYQISDSSSDAEALQQVQQQQLPVGQEWKTLVLILSSSLMRRTGKGFDAQRLIAGFQAGSQDTAIIGGFAGKHLLLMSKGKCRRHVSGAVGLALKGDVPLTALVSRGCAPLTPLLSASNTSLETCDRSKRPETEDEDDDDDDEEFGEQQLIIPEFRTSEGSIQPLSIALDAQRRGGRGPLFCGIRERRPENASGGFLLEQMSQSSFCRGGSMRVPVSGALTSPGLAYEVKLFRLDAEECRKDLRQLLGHVHRRCEEVSEEMLGSVMFTCGGRGESFFGDGWEDAKQFRAVFPSLPLVGLWAGGEIGPQALAEAAAEEATRTGRATLQGFTAVFGIFRAPVRKPRPALIALADSEVPKEVGRMMARLASEAKDRGTAAFKEEDHENAICHYSRADLLAAVPSAEVIATDRAVILANRALANLKVGKASQALNDAHAALELDPSNVKACYRGALALEELGRAPEAAAKLRDFIASSAEPAPELLKLLKQVEEAVSE